MPHDRQLRSLFGSIDRAKGWSDDLLVALALGTAWAHS